ncbi:glycosyltransferase family 4 protein [Streptomyces sp. NPDC101151]|uniref:glycosyltransferase family 4 protein n=1 Tax=Streptomyces sp. NPDC101151 TaxID=3366115 RepID=UPI00382F66EE
MRETISRTLASVVDDVRGYFISGPDYSVGPESGTEGDMGSTACQDVTSCGQLPGIGPDRLALPGLCAALSAEGGRGTILHQETLRITGPESLRKRLAEAAVRRIVVLAWRDVQDVAAGGSEFHTSAMAKVWADAGVEVILRTSRAPGHPRRVVRDGYRVVRRGGRYSVFPGLLAELMKMRRPGTGVVEVWNGVPWLAPIWAAGPTVTWVHHVHGHVWQEHFGPLLGGLGWLAESRLAPALYQGAHICTPGASTRDDLVRRLGLPASLISVIPPGVDRAFFTAPSSADSAGDGRSAFPSVVLVARMVKSKRIDLVIRAMAEVVRRHPSARLDVIGDGPELARLKALTSHHFGDPAPITFLGHVGQAELVRRYRKAWLLVSASSAEGWGLTVSEAAVCGIPAVVTDIPGHRDAVLHGVTGLLVGPGQLADAIGRLLADHALRLRLGVQAAHYAARLRWETTAWRTAEILAHGAGPRARACALGADQAVRLV